MSNTNHASTTRIRFLPIGISFAFLASLLLSTVSSIGVATTHAEPRGIVINEILANPSDGVEWVELFNASDETVDIGAWQIRDNANFHTIPAGTTLPAGGFYVGEYRGTKLNNSGETVRIDRQTGSNKTVDTINYPALDRDVSYARTTDGGNDWSINSTPSKGTSNTLQESVPAAPLPTPTLLSPPDGTILKTMGAITEKTWSAIVGATGYRYELCAIQSNDQICSELSLVEAVHTLSSDLADGTYRWRVMAIGDTDSAWTSLWTIHIDNTAPTVAFTSPDAGLQRGPIELRGSVSDAHPSTYTLTIATKNDKGVWITETVHDFTHAESFTDQLLYSFEPSKDGEYLLRLSATDQAGNTAFAERRIHIDNTAPELTIHPTTPTEKIPIISGTVDDPGSTIVLRIADHNPISATIRQIPNADGTFDWSASLIGSLLPGTYSVTVSASDKAGNTSEQTTAQTINPVSNPALPIPAASNDGQQQPENSTDNSSAQPPAQTQSRLTDAANDARSTTNNAPEQSEPADDQEVQSAATNDEKPYTAGGSSGRSSFNFIGASIVVVVLALAAIGYRNLRSYKSVQ